MSTHKLYVSAFKNLLRYLGNKPIKIITTKELDNYKNYRSEQIAKSTVNIELTCIKAIFNLALRWQWINNNPAKYVSKFRIEQHEILCFTNNELRTLLSNIPEGNLKNIVLFALYTGCRLNEILNVQFKDIDLTENILTIRNKEDFKTKTLKVRQLPISNKLRELFKSVLKQDSNTYAINNQELYLFRNNKNSKFDKTFISKKFKYYLRQSHLPEKYHFHVLRHTFITYLVRSNVNINYIKILAGHSDLSTTLQYVHIVTDDLRQAVNKVSSIYL